VTAFLEIGPLQRAGYVDLSQETTTLPLTVDIVKVTGRTEGGCLPGPYAQLITRQNVYIGAMEVLALESNEDANLRSSSQPTFIWTLLTRWLSCLVLCKSIE